VLNDVPKGNLYCLSTDVVLDQVQDPLRSFEIQFRTPGLWRIGFLPSGAIVAFPFGSGMQPTTGSVTFGQKTNLQVVLNLQASSWAIYQDGTIIHGGPFPGSLLSIGFSTDVALPPARARAAIDDVIVTKGGPRSGCNSGARRSSDTWWKLTILAIAFLTLTLVIVALLKKRASQLDRTTTE
jgi:hypothetical protein